MANDLKHLLAQLHIDKCILIGHSMGGKTAMTTALTQVSGHKMSPWIYHEGLLDVTWPFSLYIPMHYELNNPPVLAISIFLLVLPQQNQLVYLSLSVSVACFSGEAGGRGHQSCSEQHTDQLPVLHPSNAGDEDLHRHPSFHCKADGWGSTAQFSEGQDHPLHFYNLIAYIVVIKWYCVSIIMLVFRDIFFSKSVLLFYFIY